MYLKLAIKEREKHKYIFMFIILQLSISFITAICCVSVTERQYQRYRSLKPVISRVGWFIDSTLGVIYPESDVYNVPIDVDMNFDPNPILWTLENTLIPIRGHQTVPLL